MRPALVLLAALCSTLLLSCQGNPEYDPGPAPAEPRFEPGHRYLVDIVLVLRDEALEPFEPMSAAEVAGALDRRGLVSTDPETLARARAAAGGGDRLVGLRANLPPGVRYLVVGSSEISFTRASGPFVIFKSRLRVRVYDAAADAVFFDETVEGNGTTDNARQSAIDADSLAGRTMAERLLAHE